MGYFENIRIDKDKIAKEINPFIKRPIIKTLLYGIGVLGCIYILSLCAKLLAKSAENFKAFGNAIKSD
jgi:hypothetical protein